MEGVPQGLDALIKFSAQHWEAWCDHIGRKQMQDLANTEWDNINQRHGWVVRLQHVIQQVILASKLYQQASRTSSDRHARAVEAAGSV